MRTRTRTHDEEEERRPGEASILRGVGVGSGDETGRTTHPEELDLATRSRVSSHTHARTAHDRSPDAPLAAGSRGNPNTAAPSPRLCTAGTLSVSSSSGGTRRTVRVLRRPEHVGFGQEELGRRCRRNARRNVRRGVYARPREEARQTRRSLLHLRAQASPLPLQASQAATSPASQRGVEAE